MACGPGELSLEPADLFYRVLGLSALPLEHRYWTAPRTITYAARWFLAHKPAAFRSSSSSSEKTSGILDSVGQRYDRGELNLHKQRVVSLQIVQLGDAVAVRITAWADWTPT